MLSAFAILQPKYRAVAALSTNSPLRTVDIYGGANARPQLHSLAGGADIVVATPGRLTDFIDRGVITMANVDYLVRRRRVR